MDEHEVLLLRTKAVTAMFAALGRKISDTQIAGIVSATARIPYQWLYAATRDLSKSWGESRGFLGAPGIWAAAIRLAGFRPLYRAAVPPIAPRQDDIRWWPRHPLSAHDAMGEQWDQPPDRLGLADGLVIPVPRIGPPRRKALQIEHQEDSP